jgi:hypothetical protein
VTTTIAIELPTILIALMKGVVERDAAPVLWQSLISLQSRARDYVGIIGLELILDEAEGFAYLRQKPPVEGEPELPRLVTRRQLSFSVSLLLAQLRKKLAEFDATGGETRLVVSSAEILDMIRLFLPDTANQAKLKERVDRDINRIVELSFLRPLKGRQDTYEVRRILRSFVDAQWLGQLNERLATYAVHAGSNVDGDAPRPLDGADL